MVVLKNKSGLYLARCNHKGDIFNSQVVNAIKYKDSTAANAVNKSQFKGLLIQEAVVSKKALPLNDVKLKARVSKIQKELVVIVESFKAKYTAVSGKAHQEIINKALVVKIGIMEGMMEEQESRIDILSAEINKLKKM